MCGFVVLMKVVKSTLDMLPVSNTINAAQVRSRDVEMRLREEQHETRFHKCYRTEIRVHETTALSPRQILDFRNLK